MDACPPSFLDPKMLLRFARVAKSQMRPEHFVLIRDVAQDLTALHYARALVDQGADLPVTAKAASMLFLGAYAAASHGLQSRCVRCQIPRLKLKLARRTRLTYRGEQYHSTIETVQDILVS